MIDALKACGCDTAKSVLELPVEEIAARADLELEQAQKVVEILKANLKSNISKKGKHKIWVTKEN